MADSLKNRTISGVVWSAIHKFANVFLGFISGVVLARLLTPHDYGVIGMLAIFLAVSQTFIDGGFGSALIQKKNPTDEDYSTILYWNLGLSFFLYFILYMCAPYIAKFYRTLGYIYSENEPKDYHLSYCCYKHSNKYDRVGLYKAEVDREMIYLTSKEGEGRFRSDAKYWASYEPEEVLGWYNIPVLKANDRVVKS